MLTPMATTRNVTIPFLLTALFVLATACHAAADPKSRLVANLQAKQKQVVVAYGTSLTAGGAWVKQLSDSLNKKFPKQATVINSGGSGQYSKWGVANLDKRVLQKKPDAVFIEFGINDSVERFHCSAAQAKTNLETMIQRILKSNSKCEIILMTMTPGDKYPAGHRSHRKDIATYYQMYRDVAKSHELLLIDHAQHWQALQSKNATLFQKYVPDTIHPTGTGCEKVVTPAILDALGLKGG